MIKAVGPLELKEFIKYWTYNEAIDVSYFFGGGYHFGSRTVGMFSASLKRAKVRKLFYKQKVFY
jgi:hypothetical protein